MGYTVQFTKGFSQRYRGFVALHGSIHTLQVLITFYGANYILWLLANYTVVAMNQQLPGFLA